MSTRGERLSDYLRLKTGGRRGWQTALVEKSGVKRQTISKWTSPSFDGYPDLETLATVAAALDVKTFEIVAALDGDQAVSPLDPAVRSALRDEIEAALDERLGPRKAARARSGAA